MSRPLRVLIVEDSDDDARLLVRELSKLGYRPDFRRVEDRVGVRAALAEGDWDLILCDYSMPQFTALDALGMVQEMERDIPFIVISGNVGEDVAVQAMKAGAHDYLMKGRLSRLGEAIQRELNQAKVRADRAFGVAQVKHLNRVLYAVRAINRLIVQEKDPDSLLQRSAELLVETRGYQNAVFVRTDREGPVVPFVAMVDEGTCTDALRTPISRSGIPACLQHAMAVQRSEVLEDGHPECASCQFRNLHAGSTRLAGPLTHSGTTFGAVVISLPVGVTIQEGEQELFDEMVGDVAFALHGIETGEQERRVQERFRRLYENMAQGVVYQDAEGHITRCNRAAERILGLTLSQMQGRTSMDPRWKAVREDGSDFPGDEHPATVALRKGVFTKGVMGVYNPEQGQHRWISISAVPEFLTPGGAPSGVFTTFEDITRIRAAEAELREAQSIAGLGRWELDFASSVLQWSESIYELFEMKASSFGATYKAFLGVVHPDDRDMLDSAFQRSVESRAPYALTHRLRMPDGRIKWVREMGRTVCAEDGTPLRMIGTVQDVTELKEAEQELLRREEQYRKLFEGAPVGIFKTTSDGRVLVVNPALAAVLGFSSTGAVLNHYQRGGPYLERDLLRRGEFLERLEAAGQVTDFEFEAQTADGRDVWLSMSARIAERLHDGSYTVEGFTTDITERKRVEQERSRNERLLNFTGEIAKVGGWEFDVATGIPFLTRETLRIYDLPEDHHLPVTEGVKYYHPDDRALVQSAFARAIEHGEPYDLEVRFVSHKGNRKWIQTIGIPQWKNGKITTLIGSMQDITERKTRELEKVELEELYSQAQKMESVGRLAGGVAHDFNNHLSVIISYAGFVAKALHEGDPLREDIRQIEDAGKRAANLTRQLLAFSRKQVLEPKILSLNDVIADMERMLARLIGEDIEVQTVLAEDLGLVYADPGQIEQVLMNLAVNARDAMPEGGRLTIETAAVDLDEEYASRHPGATTGPHIMLAVSDNGEGMTADVRERLFEPFFTTKEKGRGTGLGLATVYGIVKQSGGTIWVYSEPGHGTTFKIYLPRTEGEKTAVRPAPRGSELRGNETVLVVEDEEGVRTLAKRILQSAGYSVIMAANAGEALLECEKLGDRIQLVLTDVIMPKLNGRELAGRLKVRCPQLKVLFMSGYTDNAIVHHGVLDAGTHFVAKPFNIPDLLRKVRQTLDADH